MGQSRSSPAVGGGIGEALASRYAFLRELSAGSSASVYLADDLRHDRRVAIKVLRQGLEDVAGATRFLREIRVTAGLNHPHITPLFDSGEAVGSLYYVMPAFEDASLRQKIDEEHCLCLDEALSITRMLIDALEYLHEHNVVHRDIKPENILLHRGVAQLADFGVAGAVEHTGGARLTHAGASIGTPAYMSPEQVAGDPTVGPRTDLYSLAVVLYEMLSGAPPFIGATVQAIVTKVLVEPARPLGQVCDGVPPHIEAAVSRAMCKEPGHRFASVGEFGVALST